MKPPFPFLRIDENSQHDQQQGSSRIEQPVRCKLCEAVMESLPVKLCIVPWRQAPAIHSSSQAVRAAKYGNKPPCSLHQHRGRRIGKLCELWAVGVNRMLYAHGMGREYYGGYGKQSYLKKGIQIAGIIAVVLLGCILESYVNPKILQYVLKIF